jgi:Flp pilus assembly protein TadG
LDFVIIQVGDRAMKTERDNMGAGTRFSLNPRHARQSRRRGSVTLLVAGGVVMMCGFAALAVDYGRSVAMKNQLQRACDAAALAGADWLPNQPANARIAAVYWAYQNGGVVVDPSNVQISSGNSTIRVFARRNVRYMFGPVIKMINGDVTAAATAAITTTNSLSPKGNSLVPIGITPRTYEINQAGDPIWLEGIRQNKESLGTNEFVLFDLRNGNNGKSPSQMQGQLQWGSTYDEVTNIGDTEQTLNAARPSETKFLGDGIDSRTNAAQNGPWADDGNKFTNIPQGSPRVVYLILTPESQPVNGNNYAPVKGFVPVYIVDKFTDKDTYRILVRMLPRDYNAGGNQTPVTNYDPALASLYRKRLIN